MPRGTGGGSIFRRGRLWWCRVYVDGQPIDESSKSDNYETAKRHLAKMNGKKVRGELGGADAKMTIDRVLDHYLKDQVLHVATRHRQDREAGSRGPRPPGIRQTARQQGHVRGTGQLPRAAHPGGRQPHHLQP